MVRAVVLEAITVSREEAFHGDQVGWEPLWAIAEGKPDAVPDAGGDIGVPLGQPSEG